MSESAAPKPGMVRLGTSAFTADGWKGSFYPDDADPREYLSHYAEQFDTVELDVTYYRVPTARTVQSWYDRTPSNFVFAAKFPQKITHEKALADCASDVDHFLRSMEGLQEKLGPLLVQLPYFNKKAFASQTKFLPRLDAFLAALPRDFRFAVEVRNKWWVNQKLMDVLAKHGAAYTMIDHSWMSPIDEIVQKTDTLTSDFTYIRWLGDRKGIEEVTKTWDATVVDRTQELQTWIDICHPIKQRGITIFGYVNNHYAGHAPATVRRLLQALDPDRKAPPRRSPQRPEQPSLL